MLVLPMLPMLRANSLAFTRSCVRTQGQTHREKHRELRMVSLPISKVSKCRMHLCRTYENISLSCAFSLNRESSVTSELSVTFPDLLALGVPGVVVAVKRHADVRDRPAEEAQPGLGARRPVRVVRRPAGEIL